MARLCGFTAAIEVPTCAACENDVILWSPDALFL